MPEPVIYIQCGDGVLYPFNVGDSFGVLKLPPQEERDPPGRFSYLHEKGEGHTHAVATYAGKREDRGTIHLPVPLVSGTEQECHHWLHLIAAALTQAGAPSAMTKPCTYGEGEMEMPSPAKAEVRVANWLDK